MSSLVATSSGRTIKKPERFASSSPPSLKKKRSSFSEKQKESNNEEDHEVERKSYDKKKNSLSPKKVKSKQKNKQKQEVKTRGRKRKSSSSRSPSRSPSPTSSPKKKDQKKTKNGEKIKETKETSLKKQKTKKKLPSLDFDPKYVDTLRKQYPDIYWKYRFPVTEINSQNPLKKVTSILHPGYIWGLQFSKDGQFLCTCSSLGSLRIWDTNTWQLLHSLSDKNEEKIEEFYVVQFTEDNQFLLAAGKLKDRYQWSEEDDDNAVYPCPIKLFDLTTGEVVERYEGHSEEILCLKQVYFKDKYYLLSASQDGTLFKWSIDSDYSLKEKYMITTDTNRIVFSISFLPNCGNKYFLAAVDDGVHVVDFELNQVIKKFTDLYTSYCDCVKIIKSFEMPLYSEKEHYFITRGVELLETLDPPTPIKPSCCSLYKLILPPDEEHPIDWKIEKVKDYQHYEFKSNSWPTKVSSNGIYILCPTSYGQVFIWNLKTGSLVANLEDHEESEVRDVLFHPTRPLLLTAGDDGVVNIYQTEEK